MKLATFNVNGVNGRLSVLLRWLAEAAPDVVCLQELKTPQEKFPETAIREAGYGVVWRGQKSWNGVAILARGTDPIETRRGLPGDPDDTHSRYIEAAVDGLLVGCLYLPNGNPAPGPKFDYKLRWFERLMAHAAGLLDTGAPIVLAGDYNVMPTDLDVYTPASSSQPRQFAVTGAPRVGSGPVALKAELPGKIAIIWDICPQLVAGNVRANRAAILRSKIFLGDGSYGRSGAVTRLARYLRVGVFRREFLGSQRR